jgi:hypothetical protein
VPPRKASADVQSSRIIGREGWNMEKDSAVFESYPASIVALTNGLSLSIYVLGSLIVARLGWVFLAVYLLYLVSLEVKQLATGCVHCCYYGRACFSGKGVVASWFFKRGDPSGFARKMTWLSLLPDMLVVLVPFSVGLFLLIQHFSWIILSLMVVLMVLAFPGNGYVRGQHACCHCRQRELGCPAEELFRQKTANEPTAAT